MKKQETKEKNIREAIELKAREDMEAKLLVEKEAEKMITAGNCAICSVSLYRKSVLDVFDRRCCSPVCVNLLRRKLTAEAAEKRFQPK